MIDFDFLIANPTRLLEILKENETLKSILETISFLIVDDYIQFRKTQMMDDVKKLVSFLKVELKKNTFQRKMRLCFKNKYKYKNRLKDRQLCSVV